MKNDSTREIRNNEWTKAKLYNLSNKLYEFENGDIMREFHICICNSLASGKTLSNLRNLEEMEHYVSVLKKYGKCLDMTKEDIETYHKLFIHRFGKGIGKK